MKAGELWRIVTTRRFVWVPGTTLAEKMEHVPPDKIDIGLILDPSSAPGMCKVLMSWGTFEFPHKLFLEKVSGT